MADAAVWLIGLARWAESWLTDALPESSVGRDKGHTRRPLDVFTEGKKFRGLVVNGVQNKQIPLTPILFKVIDHLLPAIDGNEVAVARVRANAGAVARSGDDPEQNAKKWLNSTVRSINKILVLVEAGFTVEVDDDDNGERVFRWKKVGISRKKNPIPDQQ